MRDGTCKLTNSKPQRPNPERETVYKRPHQDCINVPVRVYIGVAAYSYEGLSLTLTTLVYHFFSLSPGWVGQPPAPGARLDMIISSKINNKKNPPLVKDKGHLMKLRIFHLISLFGYII